MDVWCWWNFLQPSRLQLGIYWQWYCKKRNIFDRTKNNYKLVPFHTYGIYHNINDILPNYFQVSQESIQEKSRLNWKSEWKSKKKLWGFIKFIVKLRCIIRVVVVSWDKKNSSFFDRVLQDIEKPWLLLNFGNNETLRYLCNGKIKFIISFRKLLKIDFSKF